MKKTSIIFSIIFTLVLNVMPIYSYDEEYEEQTKEYTKEEEEIIQNKVNEKLDKMIIPYSNKAKVVIDPGHGGKDSGAVSRDKAYLEKDLNLDISNAAANYLRENGVEVIMTRSTDEWLELKERSTLSNTVNPNLFVSIHNDTGEGNGNGAHVIYSVEDKNGGPSKDLANNILNSIVENTSQNRASKGIWTRQQSDGRDWYHVIREVKAPSVIVECSYMNPTDIQAVNTLAKRKAMGVAIAKGIINTLPKGPDHIGHWAESEIQQFIDKGYVDGYEDGIFKPNNDITRAEFVKIVNKVFGFSQKGVENFQDVNSNAWYYDEICIAANAGYIDTKQSNFRPNDSITREEAAAIITSIKNCKNSNINRIKTYTDYSQVSSWALSSVEGAIEKGYMGVGIKEFRPKSNITRAEAVVTLNRVIN